MTSKRKLIYPTDEEDAIITAAALSDPDAQPLTDERLAKLKPIRGTLTPAPPPQAGEGGRRSGEG